MPVRQKKRRGGQPAAAKCGSEKEGWARRRKRASSALRAAVSGTEGDAEWVREIENEVFRMFGRQQGGEQWYERKIRELYVNVKRNPAFVKLPVHLVPRMPAAHLLWGTAEWRQRMRKWMEEEQEEQQQRRRAEEEDAEAAQAKNGEREAGMRSMRKWCRRCGARTMRFCGQMQTRRADEGMTAFYECPVCGARARE